MQLYGWAKCRLENQRNAVDVLIFYREKGEEYTIRSKGVDFGDIFLWGLQTESVNGEAIATGSFLTREKCKLVRHVEIRGNALKELCHLGVWGKPEEFEGKFLSVLGMEGHSLNFKSRGAFSFNLTKGIWGLVNITGYLENGIASPDKINFNMKPIQGDRMIFQGGFNWLDGAWHPDKLASVRRRWDFDDIYYETEESITLKDTTNLDLLFRAMMERDTEKAAEVYEDLFRSPQLVKTGEWFCAYLSQEGGKERRVSFESSGDRLVWEIQKGRSFLRGQDGETGQRLKELFSEVGDNPDRVNLEEILVFSDELFAGRRLRR